MAVALTPEEACQLVGEELGIDESCIHVSSVDEHGTRVSSLVSMVIMIVFGNTVRVVNHSLLCFFKAFFAINLATN